MREGFIELQNLLETVNLYCVDVTVGQGSHVDNRFSMLKYKYEKYYIKYIYNAEILFVRVNF